MPFNRVDYYLDNGPDPMPSIAPQAPTRCIGATSIKDGTLTQTPLIDCVQDFQVAFGLDTNADGNIETWVATLNGMTANQIQQQVREVRVFLLYQEGPGDTGKSPDFRFGGTLNLGDQDIAKSLDSSYQTHQHISTVEQFGPLRESLN